MNRGIPIIKRFEGLKLNSYLCPANVWTIGYGSTFYENGTPVKQGERISVERADALLVNTVRLFETSVRRVLKSTVTPNQLGALTSFAFNVGVGNLQRSTLLRKVNANPNDPTIRDEFMKWTRAGGRVLNGLVNRRKAEADLYFTP